MKELDFKVAWFENVLSNTLGKEVNLFEILRDSSNHTEQCKIAYYKFKDESKYKDLKKNWPLIMPGTNYCPSREKTIELIPNGLMQLDFDAKDNPIIVNWSHFRDQLSKIDIILYAGLSLSGSGVWALIKISDTTKFVQHFDCIKDYFLEYGIKIDPACSNFKLPRFLAYDKDAYFNPDAKEYTLTRNVGNNQKKIQYTARTNNDTINDYLLEIRKKCVDIAPSYSDYITLSLALSSHFAVEGEELFIAICEQHANHNEGKARKQYQYSLKNNKGLIGIASFFKLCHDRGVRPANNQNDKFLLKENSGSIAKRIPNDGTTKAIHGITETRWDLDIKTTKPQSSNYDNINQIKLKSEITSFAINKSEDLDFKKIEDLRAYFKSINFRQKNYTLKQVGTISDPNLFVSSHFKNLDASFWGHYKTPYILRLESLKEVIEEEKANLFQQSQEQTYLP